MVSSNNFGSEVIFYLIFWKVCYSNSILKKKTKWQNKMILLYVIPSKFLIKTLHNYVFSKEIFWAFRRCIRICRTNNSKDLTNFIKKNFSFMVKHKNLNIIFENQTGVERNFFCCFWDVETSPKVIYCRTPYIANPFTENTVLKGIAKNHKIIIFVRNMFTTSLIWILKNSGPKTKPWGTPNFKAIRHDVKLHT